MNLRKMISEILRVSLSNISTLISGVFVGFVIPKILGSFEYGYYKIFTLYATYIGLFTFGISEGLYLKYSGTSYDDLNKKRIRFFTKLFMIIQLIIALAMVLLAILFAKGEYKFIVITLAVYLIELNITTYYQYIAQMTMRFSDYAIRNFVKTILTIIAVACMLLIYFMENKNSISYKYYVALTLIISTILFIMYFRKFKDITIGISDSLTDGKKELNEIIGLGVPFLLASLCSTLILNIDKQFVSVLFAPSVYGIYAFAYSMLTLVTLCTSAISTVLYPSLKRVSKDNLADNFCMISSIVLVFVFFMMLSYFPLTIVVKWFLPKYTYSLDIFRIVFPGLAFTSVINVVFQNFYKLLEKNALFLKLNIFILLLSITANFVAYYLFKTPSAISFSSIAVLFIYYNVAEFYFRKNFHIKWKKNLGYILLLGGGFYLITSISNIFISAIMYILYFSIMTKFIMPETFVYLKKLLKSKGNKI